MRRLVPILLMFVLSYGTPYAQDKTWYGTVGEHCGPLSGELSTPASLAVRYVKQGYRIVDVSSSGRADEVEFMIMAPNGSIHGMMLVQSKDACEAFVMGNINQTLDPYRASYRPSVVPTFLREASRVNALDEVCRGGSGDNPATMKACSERDAIVTNLKNKGWCSVSERNVYGGLDPFWRPCN